jgi:DNA-binding response OmpR family regulator
MGVPVLVVTDNAGVREELEFGSPADFDVSVVTDARAANKAMEQSIPAAVIVDLQTGSAGGFALARDMAENLKLARVPVIMLLEREHDAWLARQAGASLYVVKPYGWPRLAGEVRRLATESAKP